MKLLVLILCSVFPVIVSASTVSNVKIKKIAIDHVYGDYAFIALESSPDRIPCAINHTWDYTLPLTDDLYRTMFSMLLAAHLSGRAITIAGLDIPACNEFYAVESAKTIYLH